MAGSATRLQHINDTHRRYLELARTGRDAAFLCRYKLETAFWRSRLLDEIVEAVRTGVRGGDATLVDELCALAIHLKPGHEAVLERDLNGELLARVMAQQGVRVAGRSAHEAAAGPGVDLKIEANRDSAWPFSRWKADPRFSQYEFSGDEVRYRGVAFRPGDVLLANVNLDGNGVYTALLDPKAYCSHSAVFAVLRDGGRRFPAVIETYEKGLRAVPLNVFVGPRYVAYAEVLRHAATGLPHAEAFGDAALGAIERAKGYNFYTEDPDRDYVSCTTLGRLLYEEVGVGSIASASEVGDAGVRRNLERLQYTAFEPFFAPVDYLLNGDFDRVGFIDNNQLPRMVARELVEERFRERFSAGVLDMRRLPIMFYLNLWAIGHIRKRSLLGKVISRAMGFDHVSLPKGPDRMLAAIEPIEAQLGNAIKRLVPHVETLLAEMHHFDPAALRRDARVQRLLDEHLPLSWLR